MFHNYQVRPRVEPTSLTRPTSKSSGLTSQSHVPSAPPEELETSTSAPWTHSTSSKPETHQDQSLIMSKIDSSSQQELQEHSQELHSHGLSPHRMTNAKTRQALKASLAQSLKGKIRLWDGFKLFNTRSKQTQDLRDEGRFWMQKMMETHQGFEAVKNLSVSDLQELLAEVIINEKQSHHR